MKKNYIKPALKPYDMAPLSILEGSVSVSARIGISSFRTDDDDWTNETDGSGNTTRQYNFWE